MPLPKPAEIKVTVRPAVPADADAVAVLLAKGQKADALPEGLRSAVAALTTAGIVTGKAGESVVHLMPGEKPTRLLVVGLGDESKSPTDAARNAGGTLAKAAKAHKLKSIAVTGGPGLDAAAVANGFVLGRFVAAEHKGTATDADDYATPPVKLTFVGPADETAVKRAVVLGEAQNFARSIATRPGNVINPPSLAAVAKELAAAVGLGVKVLDERDMAKLGMGGILGVGAGSATPPRMIVLEHLGKPAGKGKKGGPPLLVVGKSITFDTGGISIKPAANMQSMVFDKCGGMAVLGLMYALAKLKVEANVVGILSAAENHISGTAYRPGDILTMYNGVTVEITNTDAEGRLVLGDALAYGIETYKPAAAVDLATLTGACVVALGTTMAGLMSNNDALVAQLQAAATAAGEKVWRLPVDDDHREKLKSVPADIVNAPGREGGALTAAAFLSHFVPKDGSVPWAHLDIAGVADTDKPTAIYGKGATGWGVRTLFAWVTSYGKGAEAGRPTPPPAGGMRPMGLLSNWFGPPTPAAFAERMRRAIAGGGRRPAVLVRRRSFRPGARRGRAELRWPFQRLPRLLRRDAPRAANGPAELRVGRQAQPGGWRRRRTDVRGVAFAVAAAGARVVLLDVVRPDPAGRAGAVAAAQGQAAAGRVRPATVGPGADAGGRDRPADGHPIAVARHGRVVERAVRCRAGRRPGQPVGDQQRRLRLGPAGGCSCRPTGTRTTRRGWCFTT